MNLQKISRLPKRIATDLKIISIASNWFELLRAKSANRGFSTVRLRNGVVMSSPPEVALNFLFHEIWLDEFYAPKGYEIATNETVIDIGANIGVFALWAATRAKNVRVKSYEPFPKNADFFVSNVASSKLTNIEFKATAVAGDAGSRTLRVDESWILHSLTEKESGEQGVEVDCVSLDMVFADIEKCDLLKLDCEGGEYEIFYAASLESLKKIGRIVCEFNVLDMETRNGDALSKFLLNNGFVVEEMKMLDPGSGFMCARRTNA